MGHRSEQLAQETDDAARDWERKRDDPNVPGAPPRDDDESHDDDDEDGSGGWDDPDEDEDEDEEDE